MSALNDDNTRATVRRGDDSVTSFIAHFAKHPEASWATFGKSDYYLEYLRLHMLEMLRCIESELQERAAVEPTEFGT